MTYEVDKRIMLLKETSADELRKLPAYSDFSPEKKIVIATWHDLVAEGRHQFVVQGCRYGWLGVSACYAEGFVLTVDNRIEALPDDVRWEYC